MKTDRMTGFDFTSPSRIPHIRGYIDKRLMEMGSDNVTLYLPAITRDELKALRKFYKVSVEPFGYIRFEIIAP